MDRQRGITFDIKGLTVLKEKIINEFSAIRIADKTMSSIKIKELPDSADLLARYEKTRDLYLRELKMGEYVWANYDIAMNKIASWEPTKMVPIKWEFNNMVREILAKLPQSGVEVQKAKAEAKSRKFGSRETTTPIQVTAGTEQLIGEGSGGSRTRRSRRTRRTRRTRRSRISRRTRRS